MSRNAELYRSIVYYDDDCHLCGGLIAVLAKFKSSSLMQFVPIQLVSTENDFNSLLLVTGGVCYQQAEAIIRVLKMMAWPFQLCGMLLSVMPIAWLNRLYNAVAVNRYRLLGRKSCAIA